MRDAWLNPNGDVIEVGEFQHNEYASDLLTDELGFEGMMKLLDENNDCSPYEILHDRGWVRIHFNTYLTTSQNYVEILGGCVDLTKQMRNTIDPAMNSKQLRIAKEICEEHNTDFHKAINDKRFW